MKNATTIIVSVLFSVICHAQSISSSVINTSGGSVKRDDFQIEWSVGELALVNQMQVDQFIVSNGFLQPYTLFPGNFFNNSGQFGAGEIRILPNPASSFVEINFFTKQKGLVTCDFYDVLGKKIYVQQITCNGVDLIHRIPLKNLPAGTYMLRIILEAEPGYLSKHGAYKVLKID